MSIIRNFALNMLNKNPNLAQNNPYAQDIISAIQSGDAQAAQQIATRICQDNHMSMNDAQRIAEQGMQKFPNSF